MTYTTEQEAFWQGEFGNEYTDRNRGDHWVSSKQIPRPDPAGLWLRLSPGRLPAGRHDLVSHGEASVGFVL